MEVIILILLFAAVAIYNGGMTLLNVSRGIMPWHWNRQCQTEAVGLWAAIVVTGVVVTGLLYGVAALLSLWGYWLVVVLVSVAQLGVGEVFARRNERKAARQTLDARLAELRAQGPLPPWAAGIEARDTKNGNRKLSFLDRIDRWL